MRGLIWLIGLFFLAVVSSLLTRYNDGFALLVWDPWRVELSLNLLILLLFAAFTVGYILLRGLFLTLGLPARARAYRTRKQQQEVTQALESATHLWFEGRFGHALQAAEKAWQTGLAPASAALIAARCAQRLGEPEKLALWLERARNGSPDAKAAALMIEAHAALSSGQAAQARELLQALQQDHGRHLAAMELELRASEALEDGEAMEQLSRRLEKYGNLTIEAARDIRRRAHRLALVRFHDTPTRLHEYVQTVPDEELELELVLQAAERLHQLEQDELAADLVEMGLNAAEWSQGASRLVRLYGMLDCPSHAPEMLRERIARAEAWLQAHPDCSPLLLSLGNLCVRQQLWGKARSYLEASLALTPSRDAHLALAGLLEQQEEADVAQSHYRQAALINPSTY